MKAEQWIDLVAADMYTEWDIRNPEVSAVLLATRWWRMTHPLVFTPQECDECLSPYCECCSDFIIDEGIETPLGFHERLATFVQQQSLKRVQEEMAKVPNPCYSQKEVDEVRHDYEILTKTMIERRYDAVLADRRRCVELVVRDILSNKQNITIEQSGSREQTLKNYYSRLLGLPSLQRSPPMPDQPDELIDKIVALLNQLIDDGDFFNDIETRWINFTDEAKEVLATFIRDREDKARMEERKQVRAAFIHDFCNDHNEKIRWLRSIALDEDALLEMILSFFDARIPQSQEDTNA